MGEEWFYAITDDWQEGEYIKQRYQIARKSYQKPDTEGAVSG